MHYFKFYIKTNRFVFSFIAFGVFLMLNGNMMRGYSLFEHIFGFFGVLFCLTCVIILGNALIYSFKPAVVFDENGFLDRRTMKKPIPLTLIENFQIVRKNSADFLQVNTSEKLGRTFFKVLFRLFNKEFRKEKGVKTLEVNLSFLKTDFNSLRQIAEHSY